MKTNTMYLKPNLGQMIKGVPCNDLVDTSRQRHVQRTVQIVLSFLFHGISGVRSFEA